MNAQIVAQSKICFDYMNKRVAAHFKDTLQEFKHSCQIREALLALKAQLSFHLHSSNDSTNRAILAHTIFLDGDTISALAYRLDLLLTALADLHGYLHMVPFEEFKYWFKMIINQSCDVFHDTIRKIARSENMDRPYFLKLYQSQLTFSHTDSKKVTYFYAAPTK